MKSMTHESDAPSGLRSDEFDQPRPNGPPLAAVVSAAFGSFVLGLFTTMAEASEAIKEWLKFKGPVGPLSGKTTLAVVAWLVAWAALGFAWRGKQVNLRTAVIVAAVLIGLGIVGTYPSFFEEFTTK